MNIIDVYLDFACPYCYIGHHRIAEAIRINGADPSIVRYRAFQLNPTLRDAGIPRATYRINKFGSMEESRRRDAIVTDIAKRAGLTLNFDDIELTPNTRRAHRAIKIADDQHRDASALSARIFSAYFTEGRDIGNTRILAEIGEESGVKLTQEQLNGKVTKTDQAIDADIIEARKAGLTGVPYVVSLNGNTTQHLSITDAIRLLSEMLIH